MKKVNVPTTPQYCRYCGNASLCAEEIIYCEQLEKTFSKKHACNTNKCRYYGFIGFDVFDPVKIYKPRQNNKEQTKSRRSEQK